MTCNDQWSQVRGDVPDRDWCRVVGRAPRAGLYDRRCRAPASGCRGSPYRPSWPCRPSCPHRPASGGTVNGTDKKIPLKIEQKRKRDARGFRRDVAMWRTQNDLMMDVAANPCRADDGKERRTRRKRRRAKKRRPYTHTHTRSRGASWFPNWLSEKKKRLVCSVLFSLYLYISWGDSKVHGRLAGSKLSQRRPDLTWNEWKWAAKEINDTSLDASSPCGVGETHLVRHLVPGQ